MLLLHSLSSGRCLVCKEMAVDLRGGEPSRASRSWMAALGKLRHALLSLACCWLSFFLPVLRAEPPLPQGAEGCERGAAGRGLAWWRHRALGGGEVWHHGRVASTQARGFQSADAGDHNQLNRASQG